jgi:hypothetical protein
MSGFTLSCTTTDSKSTSKLCYDPQSVGQSVLVSSTHLGLTTRFLLLSGSCGFVDLGRSLWRENGSAIYNCCWSSPAQSFLGPSPAGLVTIFYGLRFETPPTWRARSPYLYPPGTGWPSYTPRHWVPFSSPPTTRRATVEVFEPASTRGTDFSSKCLIRNQRERVRVTLRLTVSQSVCLGVELSGAHDQILITVWQLLSCPWKGALSDERTGLSFVSQPAVLGQLAVCTIFTFYICHMLLNTYTIYTRRLSVRAQYSRLCPISGSFPISAV